MFVKKKMVPAVNFAMNADVALSGHVVFKVKYIFSLLYI
jgi:hypothetical protein